MSVCSRQRWFELGIHVALVKVCRHHLDLKSQGITSVRYALACVFSGQPVKVQGFSNLDLVTVKRTHTPGKLSSIVVAYATCIM